MKEIQLTQGQVALVDDEDYERVIPHKWWADLNKKTGVYRAMGCVNGKKVLMHRFIMGVSDPKIVVDHRFHNPLDNKKKNLRVCNQSLNNANQRKRKKATYSRFKGVTWDKARKKWMAKINRESKQCCIGRFNSEDEAAQAYNEKAKELFGEFALLNKISA